MSPPASAGSQGEATCAACRRRSWLLGDLSALLDYHRGAGAKLAELLQLPGEQLIAALAGSRRRDLARAYDELEPAAIAGPAGGGKICAHTPAWPAGLSGVPAERMLWLTSPRSRFVRLTRAPSVALIGGPGASPYGIETTGSLARGLAAAGVTVLAGLTGELSRAAHQGALEGKGASLALAGDGLERIRPAGSARLAREVAREGCVASELPARASGRGWGSVAAERTTLELGSVGILVEAEADAAATEAARAAMAQGRAVGVVPGPVTSRLSAGPHALLMAGATLIRDAGDALDLLYAGHQDRPGARPVLPPGPVLEGRLRVVLERVGAGEDSAERLTSGAVDAGCVLAALGELEAIGHLRRMPGGRYVVREPLRRESEIH